MAVSALKQNEKGCTLYGWPGYLFFHLNLKLNAILSYIVLNGGPHK